MAQTKHGTETAAIAKQQPPSLTRIRNNQRRSRARRKEYIQELEKRVQAFERLGAQASMEMQAAAQKVARENTQLRALLRLHGITTPGDESCPHRVNGGAGEVLSTPGPLHDTTPTSHGSVLDGKSRTVQADVGMATNCAIPESHCQSTLLANPESSNAPASSMNTESRPQSSSRLASSPVDIQPSTSYQSNPGPRPLDVEHNEHGGQAPAEIQDDATSCETAAWIIANLRGHDDAEEVRVELGCPSHADCTVKNTAVFDAMDR